MTLPETDDEFETYLKRRTVLPNGMSDHDKLEPPKALDAIVLKEAREAIHAQQRLNRAPRWARPVALAATILLCLSILLNVSLNTKRRTANLGQMTASTADTASPTATSPASEGERREKAANGTSSREAILPEAKVVEPRAARPPVLAEANTPAPDARRAHGTAADKATAFANGRAYSPAPSAPAATSAAEKAAKLADRVGIPVQATGEPPFTANSAADTQAQFADRSRTPAQAPAAAPSTANSAADQAAKLADPSRRPARAPGEAPAADSATEIERSVAGTGMATARSDSARPSPMAAAPPHPPDPKTWLQQIAALRAAGKTAQADAEMLRFRAAFPAYPAQPDPSATSEPPK